MNEAIILAAIAQIEVGLAALESQHTVMGSQIPENDEESYKGWRSGEILQSIVSELATYKEVMEIS